MLGAHETRTKEEVMATIHVCLYCRTVDGPTDNGICTLCGTETRWTPRKWSPPKKNNDRAWKRIEAGEWLWDRRRVRRARTGGFGYPDWVPGYRTVMHTHKKGQEGNWTPGHWGKPTADLGG